MKNPIPALFLAAGFLTTAYAVAQTPTSATDNTRANKTDPSNASATADSQKNNATDINLTKRIRQSVMADKSLSTDAHNVKIVSVNGGVTLNGVVRTEEERSAVEMKADHIAGADHVTNDLKIAPPK